MIISILASTSTGGIGNRGTLPWPHNKEDMQWFAQHTTGNIVVMGRNTWDDPKMPKPLPNRENYVVSSRHVAQQYQHLVKWIPSNPVDNILQIQQDHPNKDVYIIGGKKLYEATESIVDRVLLTRIKGAWFTDTRIQLDSMLACFQIKSVKPGSNCTYETWDRVMFFK
jgi:dihydrofolate reductase